MSNQDIIDIINKIYKIDVQLSNEEFLKSLSGDVLSYIGVKLSAMKASLIEVKVAAQTDMMDKETDMLREKGLAFLRAKDKYNATSASDAKYADEAFIESQRVYTKAKVNFDKLKSIVSDTHDMIDAIKSRVIDLQGARKDERVG